ncbi:MAG: hypothetical protein WAR21_12635 [Candidatus Acidiferrales bacterium]
MPAFQVSGGTADRGRGDAIFVAHRGRGSWGERPGIGPTAAAAVGLATVLFTRGPELELPRGTTLDVVLDRTLYLDADKVQFTDPGRASTLAGPPNREPSRNRTPL